MEREKSDAKKRQKEHGFTAPGNKKQKTLLSSEDTSVNKNKKLKQPW